MVSISMSDVTVTTWRQVEGRQVWRARFSDAPDTPIEFFAPRDADLDDLRAAAWAAKDDPDAG